MKHLAGFFLTVLLLSGCTDDFGEQISDSDFLFSQQGFFITNEGNFSHSNGSVSFYSFDSSKVYNNIFFATNERPLGDVVNHIAFADSLALITVNNSSKVAIASARTFVSEGAIQTGSSPRETVVVDRTKAYVSDLHSDSLTVINPELQTVEGRIYLGRSSESMVIKDKHLFIANWSQLNHPEIENNKIMVLDIATDQVTDSVQVVKEPNSMVVDSEGYLWVLSSGGFMNEELPALQKIDTHQMEVVATYHFPDKQRSPDNLAINAGGNILYFLDRGVYAMSTNAEALPASPVIAEDDRLFYSLGVAGNHMVVSDAVDYQQRGIIYVYDDDYQLKTSFRAGIIPGGFAEIKPSL